MDRDITPGRGIPAGGVAPPSNIPDILGRRALPSGRRAPGFIPRSTGTGYSPNLHRTRRLPEKSASGPRCGPLVLVRQKALPRSEPVAEAQLPDPHETRLDIDAAEGRRVDRVVRGQVAELRGVREVEDLETDLTH